MDCDEQPTDALFDTLKALLCNRWVDQQQIALS